MTASYVEMNDTCMCGMKEKTKNSISVRLEGKSILQFPTQIDYHKT